MKETESPDATSRVPVASQNARPADPDPATTDLATQLEDLICTVWESEANWRFDDRLDLASPSDGRTSYPRPADRVAADAETAR